eukprot:gene7901-16174_t
MNEMHDAVVPFYSRYSLAIYRLTASTITSRFKLSTTSIALCSLSQIVNIEPVNAVVNAATKYESYLSSDNSFSLQHPADLYESPKLLKTHDIEVFFKSESTKGFNAGVTVDQVKIGSLKDFGTPTTLAGKVQTVEKGKEGVTDVNMIRAEESMPVCEGLPAYELEYVVDSSRGLNHYLVKTTIVDKNLYVFTVQSPEAIYPSLATAGVDMINSLHVQRPIGALELNENDKK